MPRKTSAVCIRLVAKLSGLLQGYISFWTGWHPAGGFKPFVSTRLAIMRHMRPFCSSIADHLPLPP